MTSSRMMSAPARATTPSSAESGPGRPGGCDGPGFVDGSSTHLTAGVGSSSWAQMWWNRSQKSASVGGTTRSLTPYRRYHVTVSA